MFVKLSKITQNYIPLHKYYTKYFYCRFLNNGVSYMSEIFSISLWSGLGVYVCEKANDNILYESVAKNEKGKCWSLV